MPYFQLESSQSLPEPRYNQVAFIRTALTYQQTGHATAVMELLPSMDAAKTLGHYKQKISAKKASLAPSKYVLTEITLAEYDAASPQRRSPHPQWTAAAVHLPCWHATRHSSLYASS